MTTHNQSAPSSPCDNYAPVGSVTIKAGCAPLLRENCGRVSVLFAARLIEAAGADSPAPHSVFEVRAPSTVSADPGYTRDFLRRIQVSDRQPIETRASSSLRALSKHDRNTSGSTPARRHTFSSSSSYARRKHEMYLLTCARERPVVRNSRPKNIRRAMTSGLGNGLDQDATNNLRTAAECRALRDGCVRSVAARQSANIDETKRATHTHTNHMHAPFTY